MVKKLVLRGLLILSVFLFSAFQPEEMKPRIFLIGDSTMADKKPEAFPETGWGMIFSKYIDLKVFNHAVNGRSTRSFRIQGHWKTVYDQLQPGDWVFVQFGHNDAKVSDTSRYAAAQTDFRENLIRYVREIRSKGANPLLITPVVRRKFDDKNVFIDQHGDYPEVIRRVAQEVKAPLVDLHASSKVIIEGVGAQQSRHIFLNLDKNVWRNYPDGKDDNTHFTPYGASVIAAAVADGIKVLGNNLSSHLLKIPSAERYLYELPKVMDVSFKKDTFNIVKFGAIADGNTVNTNFIRDAIEACTRSGGGTVLIPPGLWVSGPIVLKSNVNLHLSQGAVLQFSRNTNLYPLVETNWEGLDAIRTHSPLYASKAENIAITGKGIIDGAGEVWRPVKRNKVTTPEWNQLTKTGFLNDEKDTWYPTERALKGAKANRPGVIAAGYDLQKAEAIKEFLRPNMVNFVRCSRVLLEGVTFQNSPAWCIHPLLTQHLTVRNITVRNPWNAQNGDGIDLESCRYVRIENSTFDVGDDGICIKSGRDEEGRRRGVPTEDVVIENCTVFHGHGGFVVGSEMSGGARNIYVSNCNFLGTDIGLRFKTTRGRGGIVEKIYIDNVRMTNIGGAAILLDMYYMAKDPLAVFGGDQKPSIDFQPVSEGTPQFRDIHISDVTCTGAETAIFVRGLPEMNIRDVEMKNISLASKKGFVCIEGEGIVLKNAMLRCDDKTVIDLQDSKNILLDNVSYLPSDTVVTIRGNRSKDIQLLNMPISKEGKELVLEKGISKTVVKRNNNLK